MHPTRYLQSPLTVALIDETIVSVDLPVRPLPLLFVILVDGTPAALVKVNAGEERS